MCSMGCIFTKDPSRYTDHCHQQHATKNLMNVSALSIVFRVVGASLLVLSSHMTATIPAKLVNMFWMSSLFSIAGGVNGLVGLTWKQPT
ncbi:hypothetical protein JVT61DRAFT_9050 [Boletus reticuloceps]|uniref:Uncharacterized protein n=1 Tax=Boletus reticuloceps TaxID=495285 RepID=A0A8I3A5Z2_9AGAM|nr:hypothetical protein JVT61DRAFT_9050 [Boletus reticuloceps]